MAAALYPAPPAGGHMQAAPQWATPLDEVGIDATDLYHQIIGAVVRGSGNATLAWDDFNFEVNHGTVIAGGETALTLIGHGMRPLDAIVWVNGQNKPGALAITVGAAGDEEDHPANDIYSGFFSWYFSLFSQGRAVSQGAPNFLVSVLGLGAGWANFIADLTTAGIDKFPTEWVKNVDLAGLGDKSRNRLALGAAGHRYVSSLKYIRPEDFVDGADSGREFIAGIRTWTGDRVWWDLHPITKSGAIITVTGSVNKLLEDCLASSIDPARLQVLVTARILHHLPNAVPTHGHWAGFDLTLLPVLAEPIF